MSPARVDAPLKASCLLIGEETFLIEEHLSALKALQGDGSSMNRAVYHAQEIHRMDEVIELCNTWPFLSDRRIVVIRDAHKLALKDIEILVAYLKNPCETTTLVITIEGQREEKKLMKMLPKGVEVLRFDALKGRELIDWILSRVKKNGLRIDRDAAFLLAEITGGNTWFIASEIEKLSLFTAGRAPITLKDVQYLVARSVEPSIFAFLDSLFDKKKDVALRLYELESSGVTELELISRIERQAELHYRILCSTGKAGKDVHPYVERKIALRKALWTAPQLVNLLGGIRGVEQGIKSGRSLHPYASIHEAILSTVFPA